MGGKSRSTQSTTNQQSTNNIVNDGKFAGAGDVTIDESTHSIEDSGNSNSSINDSGNTDNSIENDGDYAGNNGTITLSDSGAIDAARDIATAALTSNESVIESAFGFGSDALDEVQSVASSVIGDLRQFGSEAIGSVSGQATDFAESLQHMLESSQQSNQRVLESAVKTSSEDKAIIADLARSTSLAGQDLVAKSSQKMTLYMAIALGIGFIALVAVGSND